MTVDYRRASRRWWIVGAVAVLTIWLVVLGLVLVNSSSTVNTRAGDDDSLCGPSQAQPDLVIVLRPEASATEIHDLVHEADSQRHVEGVDRVDRERVFRSIENVATRAAAGRAVDASDMPSLVTVDVDGDDQDAVVVGSALSDHPAVLAVGVPVGDGGLRSARSARFFDEGVEVVLFLDPYVARTEAESLQERVDRDRDVASYTYFDQEAAYEEFADLFRDQPELVDSVTPDQLPPSIRIVAADEQRSTIERIQKDFEKLPGIREVVVVSPLIELADDYPRFVAALDEC